MFRMKIKSEGSSQKPCVSKSFLKRHSMHTLAVAFSTLNPSMGQIIPDLTYFKKLS